MNDHDLNLFHWGYDECRNVTLSQLREILRGESDCRQAVRDLIERQEAEAKADHWKRTQREFPGITREEYEAELEGTDAAIREKYYGTNGRLKARLVRPGGRDRTTSE